MQVDLMNTLYQQYIHCMPAGLWSCKDMEVFGWSWIPKNTRSRSQIFCVTAESFFTSHS